MKSEKPASNKNLETYEDNRVCEGPGDCGLTPHTVVPEEHTVNEGLSGKRIVERSYCQRCGG